MPALLDRALAKSKRGAAGAFLTWDPDNGGPMKALYFDCVTEISVENTASATEHPVELGANVSDHVKKELDRLSLEIFVSQTPLFDLNDHGGVEAPVNLRDGTPNGTLSYVAPFAPTPGAVFSAIGGAVKSLFAGDAGDVSPNVFQFSKEIDFVAETEQVLAALQKEVQLVDITTAHKVYEHMFLEHYSVQKDAGTGTGATIKLDFKEIRKVSVGLTTAPIPTEVRGEIAVVKGAQPAVPAKAPEAKKKTMAKKLIGPHIPGINIL